MDERANETQQERGDALIAHARLTNAQRDRNEREYGFTAVSDCEPFEILRTAAWAVKAGLTTNDWACVAEGYVLLEHGLTKLGEWR